MQSYFNTSQVNVNLYRSVLISRHEIYFNTSHVNVNHRTTLIPSKISSISIHLMLMLITKPMNIRVVISDFNTSHVNVNLRHFHNIFFLCLISIHLMLMLITYLCNQYLQ